MPRIGAYAATLIGVLAVWWAAVLVKLAGVTPPVAAWWRFVVGGVVVTLEALLRGEGPSPRPALLAAGALLYLHILLWFHSLEAAPILASTALVTTYPVFIAVAEVIMGEVPFWKAFLVSAPLIAAAAYAASGVNPAACLESLSSALAVSGYFLILRRARLAGLSADSIASSTYLAAAGLATIHDMLAGVNPLAVPQSSLPYLVALGLVPMALGHTLLNYALAYLPATVVTGAVLTEPLGAALLGRLILGETPPPEHLALALTLLAASAAALYPQTSMSRRPRYSSLSGRRNGP